MHHAFLTKKLSQEVLSLVSLRGFSSECMFGSDEETMLTRERERERRGSFIPFVIKVLSLRRTMKAWLYYWTVQFPLKVDKWGELWSLRSHETVGSKVSRERELLVTISSLTVATEETAIKSRAHRLSWLPSWPLSSYSPSEQEIADKSYMTTWVSESSPKTIQKMNKVFFGIIHGCLSHDEVIESLSTSVWFEP